ncbi:MAG TPA: DUF192 domain-containing protein [Baekduia sp.]|nr:DUF192 domain-containing protein [Baekduia sp.]
MPVLPRRLRRLPAREAGPFTLLLAFGPLQRLLGLTGLGGLPPRTAVLLPATRSVHTWGMRFPIDLVWLDGRGRPVAIDTGVERRRLRGQRGARAVVECRAGEGPAVASTLWQACRRSTTPGALAH